MMGEYINTFNTADPQLPSLKKNEIKKKYRCNQCDSSFTRAYNLIHHLKTHECHFKKDKLETRKYKCDQCGAVFTRLWCLARHMKKQSCKLKQNEYICNECSKSYKYKSNLINHLKNHFSSARKVKEIKHSPNTVSRVLLQRGNVKYLHCHRCTAIFKNRSALYRHFMLQHNQSGGNLQEFPWRPNNEPWLIDGKIDNDFKETYLMHMKIILQNHEIKPITSVYNFPTDNTITINKMMEHISYIYREENRAFKMNISFGIILRNIETGKYRYYKPYTNDSVLAEPILVSKTPDLNHIRQNLEEMDILSFLLRQRPSTKFEVSLLSNIQYFTFAYLDFNLGGLDSYDDELPAFIKQRKCIWSLDKDRNHQPYKDNLCFFRCLTFHKFSSSLFIHNRDGFEQQSLKNFEYFNREMGGQTSSKAHFKGVNLGKMFLLESCFKINVNVFEMYEDGSCTALFKSLGSFRDTMNLNKYKDHLSYISDINQYCRKFRCSICSKLWRCKSDWERHELTCASKDTLQFVGGYFKPNLSIFEEMEAFGIQTPKEQRFFKDFIVFDMEARMHPIQQNITEKFSWNYEHIPVSVSICTNYKGYTQPVCIVKDNVDELTREMITYISSIASFIREDKIKSFELIFQQLDYLCYEWENIPLNSSEGLSSAQKIMLNQINRLIERLNFYCSEVPVLGFNSGRYDINLIKGKILKQLKMHEISKNSGFVIKKNNSYSCISNGELRFLDVSNFLSPGTSYVKFLQAYGASQSKSFFPYEYFKVFSQLEETQLPPIGDAWFSSVKGKSVLGDDADTISKNYNWLLQKWSDENMRTFKDFLVWYNNLDVGPFVEALSNLTEFYFQNEIDVLKETVSIPGISRKMMYRSAKKERAVFSLIDKANSDLYYLIKNNIVGGPSIIFKRFCQRDETFVRNNLNRPCKRVIGYDANSLYLWSIGQKMPCGGYIRRKCENNFSPIKSDKYDAMFYWMDWENLTHSLNILHFRNAGFEKRIGHLLVDGFDPDTKTVYQFHGCFYHAHECILKKTKDEKQKRKLISRQKMTQAGSNYIKSQGYKLVEIYECEFNNLKKTDHNLREFVRQQLSLFTRKKPGQVTETEIIGGILSDDLFGMAEVDISVPNSWGEVYFKPETPLDPYSYFSEMCPIFGNIDVPFEEIGDLMKEYIEEFDLSKRPRRLLIGAMKAEKILLATPLLKWYIKHGMKITKIHQTVEYNTPSHCFKGFVDEVTKARRQGDLDPKKSVIADTMKLCGNAAYGSTLLSLEKQRKINYVSGFEKASNAVNNPLFEKLSELEPDFYEIQNLKTKHFMKLPYQTGFFILQYAKLRMLQFYFDFIDWFLNREDFAWVCMDTDSAYLELAAETLEELIKPTLWGEYIGMQKNFCSDHFSQSAENMLWFPRTCCEKHNKFDQRTPGLFKTEFSGDLIISLASKTYLIAAGEKYKFSSKGVNKGNISDPINIFKTVLQEKKPLSAQNIGFRLKDNKMCTYTLDKNAFSYLYCKRKVLSDGINTAPLNVTLQPSIFHEKRKSSPQSLVNMDDMGYI
jgi:hypothetical protein